MWNWVAQYPSIIPVVHGNNEARNWGAYLLLPSLRTSDAKAQRDYRPNTIQYNTVVLRYFPRRLTSSFVFTYFFPQGRKGPPVVERET